MIIIDLLNSHPTRGSKWGLSSNDSDGFSILNCSAFFALMLAFRVGIRLVMDTALPVASMVRPDSSRIRGPGRSSFTAPILIKPDLTRLAPVAALAPLGPENCCKQGFNNHNNNNSFLSILKSERLHTKGNSGYTMTCLQNSLQKCKSKVKHSCLQYKHINSDQKSRFLFPVISHVF